MALQGKRPPQSCSLEEALLARVGRPGRAAVVGLAEVDIRHVTESSSVVASIVERKHSRRRSLGPPKATGKKRSTDDNGSVTRAGADQLPPRSSENESRISVVPCGYRPSRNSAETAVVGAAGTIGSAGGIEQRAAEGLRGRQCLEANRLAGYHHGRTPGVARPSKDRLKVIVLAA